MTDRHDSVPVAHRTVTRRKLRQMQRSARRCARSCRMPSVWRLLSTHTKIDVHIALVSAGLPGVLATWGESCTRRVFVYSARDRGRG